MLIYTLKYSTRDGEILLMEEILHQLRLVVYPIYKVLDIPVGCLGFLQQDKNRYPLRTTQMSWSSCRGGHGVTDEEVGRPDCREAMKANSFSWMLLFMIISLLLLTLFYVCVYSY